MKSCKQVFNIILIFFPLFHTSPSVEGANTSVVNVHTNGYTNYTILTYLGVNIEVHRDFASHLKKVQEVFFENEPNAIAIFEKNKIIYGEGTTLIYIVLYGSGVDNFKVFFPKKKFSRLDLIKTKSFGLIELKSLIEVTSKNKLSYNIIGKFKINVFIKTSSTNIRDLNKHLLLKKFYEFEIGLEKYPLEKWSWSMKRPNFYRTVIKRGSTPLKETAEENKFYVEFNFERKTPMRTKIYEVATGFNLFWLSSNTLSINASSGKFSCLRVFFEVCQAFNLNVTITSHEGYICDYELNATKALKKIFPCRLFIRILWDHKLYEVKTMVPFDYKEAYRKERLHKGILPKFYYEQEYEDGFEVITGNYFPVYCALFSYLKYIMID